MKKAVVFDCFGVLYVTRQFSLRLTRNQELLDYIETLRPKYKIGMLTNSDSTEISGYFTLTERKKIFDTVVLSADEGISKPDPAIYELTCQRLGVAPHEAILVDDSQLNCEAAEAMGMGVVRYSDLAQMKSELEQL